MTQDLLESLPLAQRLALSYARGSARETMLTLLLLDNRLATILRQRSEALIAQIKLAWWRDRLREDPVLWPAGEPLLERLRDWPASAATLVPLVDGWEGLLSDTLSTSALEEFAQGRAAAWQALAGTEAISRPTALAARQWALCDLAVHLDDGDEAASARDMALAAGAHRADLPRSIRPLAVLHGLALRAVKRGSSELIDGPRAALVALRIGLAGR